MATPDQGEGAPTPLDAERARLRAKGWSDDKIEKILFEREVAGSQQSPAAGAAPVQGNMTGVLGNASAALSHARGAIPALKSEVANLSDPNAPPQARAKSAVVLACAALIVAVLGYALYQEWQIHIVNAPITATGQATKTTAEACSARMQQLTQNMNIEDFNADGRTVKSGSPTAQMIELYNRDCAPAAAAPAALAVDVSTSNAQAIHLACRDFLSDGSLASGNLAVHHYDISATQVIKDGRAKQTSDINITKDTVKFTESYLRWLYYWELNRRTGLMMVKILDTKTNDDSDGFRIQCEKAT